MQSERILRVKELFLLALDLDEEQRRSCLDAQSAGDVELRRTVERLLRHAEGSADDGLSLSGADDGIEDGGGDSPRSEALRPR